jgi:hypothetical protein
LTPTVFGEQATNARVGIVHGGSCAFAIGTANEAAIVNVRNKAINVVVLFFANFIFLSPYFYKQENIINRLFLYISGIHPESRKPSVGLFQHIKLAFAKNAE